MTFISPKAQRLLAALTRPMQRQEWIAAAFGAHWHYPVDRQIGELCFFGYAKKLSTPDGNFFIRLKEFPTAGAPPRDGGQ